MLIRLLSDFFSSGFTLFVGLLSMIISVWQLYKAIEREKKGYNTSGEVVDFVGEWKRLGSKSTYSRYPVIKFTNQDGQLIRQKSDFGMFPNFWRKGKVISIVYFNGQIHPTGTGYIIFYSLFVFVSVCFVLGSLIANFSQNFIIN